MRAVPLCLVVTFGACSSESIQPGNWETKSELAGATRTVSRCIEASEAADPVEPLVRTAMWAQCQLTDSRFSGGVISAQANCTGFTQDVVPRSINTSVSLEGSYTATSIDARISATDTSDAGATPTTGTVNSRRLGDCPTE